MRTLSPGVVSRFALGAAPSPAIQAWDLAVLIALGLLLRLLSYNGILGSDDGVYFERAVDVATGTWSSADYNGALRYGFNIPAGLFIGLFGATPFVANLWPLLCSLVEVAVVYLLAAQMLGRRAGAFSGLLLATAPLHMAVATRVHADPVVSMFITLSFALLWGGWAARHKGLLFACGLAIGSIFWAKELVAIVWLAFLPMLWMFRGRWLDALVVVAGTLIMLLLHGLLMTWVAGHPLHLIQTVLGQVKTSFIGDMQGEDAAGYYLKYLFVDLRHVGLVAILAVLGAWWVPRSLRLQGAALDAWVYVLAWALGVLAVLSVFPVSLSPLRFTMKQTNYITLYLGAFAVLAGMALACMPRQLAHGLAAAAAGLGIWLAFLQQADYRAFGAGSKAVGHWVSTRPEVLVVGSTNNAALGGFQARMDNPAGPRGRIVSFRELAREPEATAEAVRSAKSVYAAFDVQTRTWFSGGHAIQAPLACWGQAVEELAPADLGLGNRLAAASASLAAAAGRFGLPGMGGLSRALNALAFPVPVKLYRIDGTNILCRP